MSDTTRPFQPSGVITLLTDFGLGDPFVGVMHGVVLSRFPAARIVDLTHGVAPQRVPEGCFWLERSFRWFPAGTVHVAVVDPGVGSARAALLVEREGHVFLGPDNGLLGGVMTGAAWVRVLEPGALGVDPPSATFHGRDLFAPVAAELASGRLSPAQVGPPAVRCVPSPLAEPRVGAEGVTGEVVTVDRFGNLITTLRGEHLAGCVRVRVGRRRLRVVRTYADARPGEAVALLGSFDAVEVAVRDASATTVLGVGCGARVVALRPTGGGASAGDPPRPRRAGHGSRIR